MKIQIPSKRLKGLIEKMGTVTRSRAPMPVLTHILLHAQGSTLRATGTNLDATCVESADCEVLTEGSALMSIDKFRGFLENSEEIVEIEYSEDGKGRVAKLSLGKFNKKGKCLPVEEFPGMKQPDEKTGILMPGDVLLGALDAVSSMACKGESIKSCVNFNFSEEGRMRVNATDGRRVASLVIKTPEKLPDFNLPRSACEAIAKVLPEGEDISIFSDGKLVQLQWSSGSFTSKLFDGTYFNVLSIIKVVYDPAVKWNAAPKATIPGALARVCENHQHHKVVLHSKAGLMKIVTDAGHTDYAEDVVAINGEGFEKCCLNGQYFIDAIKACPTEKISIAYAGGKQFLMKSADDLWISVIALAHL